jgi:hypothetical protein
MAAFAAAASDASHQAMFVAAKAMAMTAADLLTDADARPVKAEPRRGSQFARFDWRDSRRDHERHGLCPHP